ncbi:DUF4136 domain-containing protein [Photobacterium makurazakiensis]|uniref:DUF4136 domain-containing protein n=1 Tax=Photobacterium makurazakiensis TaxID=2910234 RepID=UPI003D0F4885
MKRCKLFLGVLLLAGCTSDVATDYNSATNYAVFKTYQFASSSNDHALSLDAARVEDAISGQLYAKGLKPAQTDADLTVQHSILEQSDFQSYGTSFGFGYGYRNVGVAYSAPRQYKEYRYGKLVVELIENNTNQIVWRSVSQRKLTETMSPDSRRKFIDEQIREMFKNYPPH